MSHRNEERDDYRNSSRHSRQDIQPTTTIRTQHMPSPRHNMDRNSVPAVHHRSGGYGKLLFLFCYKHSSF